MIGNKEEDGVVLDAVALQQPAQPAERVVHLAERAEVVPRRLAERVSVRVVPLRQRVMRHVVGRQRDIRQEGLGGRLLQEVLEQTDGERRQVAGDLRRCFSG